MFKQLEQHLDTVNLVITLSKKDDKISYSILPKSKEKNKDMGLTPLTGSGTAEELDEKIGEIVQQAFGGANAEALHTVSQFTDGLLKKAAEATKSATTTTSKTTTTTTKKEEKPKEEPKFEPEKLKGDEKKAWGKIKGFIDNAGKRSDEEGVDFYEKQALTEGANIKSAAKLVEPYIKDQFTAIRTKLLESKKEIPAADGLFAGSTEVVADPKETEKAIADAQTEATVVEVPKTEPVKTEKPQPAADPAPPTEEPSIGFETSSDESTDEDEDEEEADEEVAGATDDGDTENTSATPEEVDIF